MPYLDSSTTASTSRSEEIRRRRCSGNFCAKLTDSILYTNYMCSASKILLKRISFQVQWIEELTQGNFFNFFNGRGCNVILGDDGGETGMVRF